MLNYEKYEATKGNISGKYFENEVIGIEDKTIRINDDRFLSIIVLDIYSVHRRSKESVCSFQ